MAITDPSRIAAAAAVKGAAATANTGTGKLSGVTVTDATHANLRNPAAIVFTSATTYTIDGGPPQTYTPGQTISVNGWSFVLDGAPKVGDTFNITPPRPARRTTATRRSWPRWKAQRPSTPER